MGEYWESIISAVSSLGRAEGGSEVAVVARVRSCITSGDECAFVGDK